MALVFRSLTPSDVGEILDYENRRLADTIINEADRNIHSWNARWRKESLEFYAQSGWSFLVRDEDVKSPFSPEGLLMGYFLGQTLVYLDGHVQTLWVEHIQFSSLQARDELCDLAVRAARDKHFQKVVFPNVQNIKNTIKQLKAEEWNTGCFQVATTKG